MERVGKTIGPTEKLYLSSTGEVLYAFPKVIEVIFGPDGEERERREPQYVRANVNEDLPVRWTGRKMPKNDAVHHFAFRRTIQLRHDDGLTFEAALEEAKTVGLKLPAYEERARQYIDRKRG